MSPSAVPLFVSGVADELVEGAVGAVEREGDQAAAVLSCAGGSQV